jgi:hypothetical protein
MFACKSFIILCSMVCFVLSIHIHEGHVIAQQACVVVAEVVLLGAFGVELL